MLLLPTSNIGHLLPTRQLPVPAGRNKSTARKNKSKINTITSSSTIPWNVSCGMLWDHQLVLAAAASLSTNVKCVHRISINVCPQGIHSHCKTDTVPPREHRISYLGLRRSKRNSSCSPRSKTNIIAISELFSLAWDSSRKIPLQFNEEIKNWPPKRSKVLCEEKVHRKIVYSFFLSICLLKEKQNRLMLVHWWEPETRWKKSPPWRRRKTPPKIKEETEGKYPKWKSPPESEKFQDTRRKKNIASFREKRRTYVRNSQKKDEAKNKRRISKSRRRRRKQPLSFISNE